MKLTSHLWYIVLLLLSVTWAVNNAGKNIRLEEHVLYLEEYIQENHLPTPVYPVRRGKVVTSIDVPICTGEKNEQVVFVDGNRPVGLYVGSREVASQHRQAGAPSPDGRLQQSL